MHNLLVVFDAMSQKFNLILCTVQDILKIKISCVGKNLSYPFATEVHLKNETISTRVEIPLMLS
jgi:hypothetical protein